MAKMRDYKKEVSREEYLEERHAEKGTERNLQE